MFQLVVMRKSQAYVKYFLIEQSRKRKLISNMFTCAPHTMRTRISGSRHPLVNCTAMQFEGQHAELKFKPTEKIT